MNKIRVCIVDDHPVVRQSLSALLSGQPDMEVVGEAEDGAQGVEVVQETKPDVVVLDLLMPRQDGVETILEMKKLGLEARVLVLSSSYDGELFFDAMRVGATGCMPKDVGSAQLLDAIRGVAAGQACLHASIANRMARELGGLEGGGLSASEGKTLQLLAGGSSNQEIAATLGLKVGTVERHLSSALRKLQMAKVSE